MKKNNVWCFVIIAAFGLLSGCKRVPSYHRRSLSVVGENFSCSVINRDVVLRAKLCTAQDKKDLFGERGEWLRDDQSQPLQVIYFSFNNLSNHVYVISPDDIDLDLVSYEKVVNCMQVHNRASRFAKGYGIGLGISGIVPLLSMGFQYLSPLLMYAPFVVVISFVQLTRLVRYSLINNCIMKDLREKTLHSRMLIQPGEHCQKLVFVEPFEYKSAFAVEIHKKDELDTAVMFDVEFA